MPVTKPINYVLIHGAWQGRYVWKKVKAELEENGGIVTVVDLPAHGNDKSSPQSQSLNTYRDKVTKIIDHLEGKVVLVGHSMGGMVISAVAEKIPSKIQKLIYIGAFLPKSGQSLIDLSKTDSASLIGPNIRPSADKLT